jgi:diaminopimelate decarboxylase
LKHIDSNSGLNVGLRINVGSLLKNGFDPAPRLGINIEEISKAIRINKDISTLHVYLGTNILESSIYKNAIISLLILAKKYPNIKTIDLGGGLAFNPNDNDFAKEILLEIKTAWDNNKHSNIKLILEPGRALVRSAAKFFVKVEDIKNNNGKQFIVVNSSGTWYPRKIIHDANDHFVSVFGRPEDVSMRPSVIAGNTTFSKDFLAELDFPKVKIGDIIEFKNAGAYCESMHLDFLGICKPNIYFINLPQS